MKQLAISLLFILCVVGCKAKSSAGSDQQNPEKAPPPVMAAKITPPMTPAGTDPATKLAAMATTNPKAAPATNPAGSTVRYYFFDGCWDGRGKSVEEAREKCKKLGKTGRVWQRKGCLCNDPHLITVKSADPVAFYFMSTHLHHLGKTPAIVRKKCQKGREESIKKGITADYDCAKEKIRKAHGPYTRVFAFSDFDDPKQFVYLDTEEGVWMDETGEAP
ncbi:hypothetical protein KJ865_00130, partial [Myxococcota bacterium]|nr:hypothetical protein [Myxococcota bacterium]